MDIKAKIVDEVGLKRVITRISHEILEKNKGSKNLVLMGMRTRGEFLAKRLHEKIKEIENIEVPFGVVELDGHHLGKVKEKPVFKIFVNAGIYVINPRCLESLEDNVYCDMPELLQKTVEEGERVACFHLREYWIDIGRQEQFKKANDEYNKHFCDPHNNLSS